MSFQILLVSLSCLKVWPLLCHKYCTWIAKIFILENEMGLSFLGVYRMLEQVPTQMGEGAVQWAKLVIPLVVHSASKVRLRAAAAMEMGMPLLLEKQNEVSAVIETMMSTVSSLTSLWSLMLGVACEKGTVIISAQLSLCLHRN